MYTTLTGVDLAKKAIQDCVVKSRKIVRNLVMSHLSFLTGPKSNVHRSVFRSLYSLGDLLCNIE